MVNHQSNPTHESCIRVCRVLVIRWIRNIGPSVCQGRDRCPRDRRGKTVGGSEPRDPSVEWMQAEKNEDHGSC
jgi:hypothetical protein